MRRLLKEPLLHFVLLGVLLFAVDARLRGRVVDATGDDIVVSQGRIENLAALFAKTWHRPPTNEELRGLIDDFVLEEALYREGVAMGVAEDDALIRRRVRQKVEFLVGDLVDLAEPDEADLEAWLAEHAHAYARPGRVSFRQVYFNPDRRGVDLRDDAARLLAQLSEGQSSVDPFELGDASMLGPAFDQLEDSDVVRTFGEDFAGRLAELPTGVWSGPLESPYGLHLILVDSRTEGRPAVLEEVRAEVERDWGFAEAKKNSSRFYEEVVARYRVSIDWPEFTADIDDEG